MRGEFGMVMKSQVEDIFHRYARFLGWDKQVGFFFNVIQK